MEKNQSLVTGALIGAAITGVAVMATQFMLTPKESSKEDVEGPTLPDEEVVLSGDVGGSNVRLELLRLSRSNIDSREVVKQLKKYNT